MSDAVDRDDDRALAGEFVLRLMDDEMHRAFAARVAAEPELARMVRDWEEDLAGLAEAVPEVAPPPRIRQQLRTRLFGADSPRRSWFGLRLWGAVAAAALVAVFVLVQVQTPTAPDLVAEIAAEDRGLVLRAAYSEDNARLTVDRVAGDIREGRAQELWLIAEGAAPVSLGLLTPGAMSQIAVPAGLRPALAGATLAVSDEPAGGSPTGQPTGAVLAAGVFVSG